MTRSVKAPRQARGEDRVERLLTAAAELFAARGVDAVTMTEIAAAAASAIGTLYQFFPRKADVAAALAERYARQLRALVDGAALGGDAEADLALAKAIDRLATFYIDNPAYIEVQHALNRPGAETGLEAALDADVLGFLRQLIGLTSPALKPTAVDAAARVMLEAGHALLSALALAPPETRGSLLHETQRMLRLDLRGLNEDA